jgi:hypothetical protein
VSRQMAVSLEPALHYLAGAVDPTRLPGR